MSKPKTPAEARWRSELREMQRHVIDSRAHRAYIRFCKRQLSKVRRWRFHRGKIGDLVWQSI